MKKFSEYVQLMRLHKPVGIFLLLWPTLGALWLAGRGHPDSGLVFIFVAGVLLMRSAGCVINDYADRNWDKHVARTRDRPLTAGRVTEREALVLFFILMLLAFLLVLFLNPLSIVWAFFAAAVAMIYPFLKRWIPLPQAGLGIAFALGVPMAFAAQNNSITLADWQVFLTAMIWPFMYDTLYAMSDRLDDKKIGIQSSAILFGGKDRIVIACLQMILIALWIQTGVLFHLKWPYFAALVGVALLFCYQQWLIRDRNPDQCLMAFLNNQWAGLFVFIGIVLS